MRAVFLGVFAICALGGLAFAQEVAGQGVAGIAGFKLGMSRAEAEAAHPGRWGELGTSPIGRLSDFTPNGDIRAPALELGGDNYSVRLVFRRDALRVVTLQHVRQGPQRACEPHFLSVLSHLEATYGPLTGEETPWDASGQTAEARQSVGGSHYRVYLHNGGWRARANSGHPYRLQVSAMHIPPGGPGGCIVAIDVRDDFGLGAELAKEEPPALAELERSPIFESGAVVTLPGFENINTLIPKFAQDFEFGGVAQLRCLVRDNLTFWCRVIDESPPESGFGQSALAMMQYLRAAPAAEGGAPPGSQIVRRVRFANPAEY